MQQLPEQKRPQKRLEYVDVELLGNKKNVSVFKKAAYAFGVGFGFFIILPLLPDVGDPVKSKLMINLFHTISICMILYSVDVGVAFFFMRSNLKFIMFLLNWVVVPSFGIWAVMQGYDILTATGGATP